MAHLPRQQLVSFLSLLPPRYVDKDAEHYPSNHANIISQTTCGHPPHLVCDYNAEVDFIGPRDGARCRKCRSHSVAVGRMDVSREVFKRNELAYGHPPETISSFVQGELVAVNVP